MSEVEVKAKTFTESHKGESSDEILAQMRGEEPVSEDLEEAATNYATHLDENWSTGKDGYIAENEKAAFKAGAKWQEQQIFKLKEGVELFSEDESDNFDEEFAKTLGEREEILPNGERFTAFDLYKVALHFCGWKKRQMMKDATDVTVHIEAGNYPYIPQIELYDYDKDVPLAKEGDKYKVVLIKED